MPDARSQSRRKHGCLPAATPGNYAVRGWLTAHPIKIPEQEGTWVTLQLGHMGDRLTWVTPQGPSSLYPRPARDRWADEAKLGSLVIKEAQSNVSEEHVVHAVLLLDPDRLSLERVPDRGVAPGRTGPSVMMPVERS